MAIIRRRAKTACRAVVEGDIDGLIHTLNELYKPLTPVDLKGQKEQLVFKALSIILGLPVLTEVYAGKGRLDALVTTEGHNYIFEFKVDSGTAECAMKEIKEKHYDWILSGDSKPLHLVGIDFRTEKRQIVSYTHQLYEVTSS